MSITFVLTTVTLQTQKDDGLIVNLSGRQRMLTQKMTKEALIFNTMSQRPDQKDLDRSKGQLISTIKVFETTLFALVDGGSAPLNLEMTKFRELPPAETPEIKAGLAEVVNLWRPFKAEINKIIESRGEDMSGLEYVISENALLLSKMNNVVFLMQGEAEQKVSVITKSQIAALLLGILIVFLSLLSARKTLSEPLTYLNKMAHDISMGDLKKEVQVKGKIKEISQLGESFNRMRASLITMLSSE